MNFLAPEGTGIERCIAELQLGIRREENFDQVFARYYRPVFGFFAKQGIPTDQCDDLTQEVFLRVYKSIGRFRGEASFETWLFRIAWNLWSKVLRSKIIGAQKAREVPLDETVEPDGLAPIDTLAAGNQDDPLHDVLSEERRTLLHRELRSMPPQMRRCILLRVDYGLKYREIAALMQISIDAVKSHLNQAKNRLRQRLGEPRKGFSS